MTPLHFHKCSKYTQLELDIHSALFTLVNNCGQPK